MSSSRFQQFANNGYAPSNSLGVILEDAAFSAVEAQTVEVAPDCNCLHTVESCLYLPCDLEADCEGKTLPLIDRKTQNPFVIKHGTRCTVCVYARRCLPECASFCLGTIQTPECATECDNLRWISESNAITGAQLNRHKIVEAKFCANRNLSCPLYACKTDDCGNCTTNMNLQTTTCDGSEEAPAVSTSACTGCGTDGEGQTLQNGDRCFYTGDGGNFAGDLAGAWIGVTLTNGTIEEDCLVFSVETKELHCIDLCDDKDQAEACAFPTWINGGI